MLKDSKCLAFLSCLQFAIQNSSFNHIILKSKQVLCLEYIFLQRDTLAVLPTGYGKSLVFYLTPALLFAKKNQNRLLGGGKITTIVIFVSLLNALIKDQVNRLSLHRIEAVALDVKGSTTTSTTTHDDDVDEDIEDEPEDITISDFQFTDREKLEIGGYNIVFAHPEFLVSKYGRTLLQSKPYQENVCAVVIDEAHCILEW